MKFIDEGIQSKSKEIRANFVDNSYSTTILTKKNNEFDLFLKYCNTQNAEKTCLTINDANIRQYFKIPIRQRNIEIQIYNEDADFID